MDVLDAVRNLRGLMGSGMQNGDFIVSVDEAVHNMGASRTSSTDD